MIEGTDLQSADAPASPTSRSTGSSTSTFDGDGDRRRSPRSRGALIGTEKQFAIVLDGQVISAPTMDGLITNGEAEISGNFTEAEAQSLATSLKYGALPIAFDDDTRRSTSSARRWPATSSRPACIAGALGLLLVMLYCLLYYRGLGLVVHRVAARGGGDRRTRWCCC